MRGQKTHAVTLVHGQGHVGQISDDEDELLSQIGAGRRRTVGGGVQGFEGGVNREQGLEWSDGHHDHHHDWEDGDRVA